MENNGTSDKFDQLENLNVSESWSKDLLQKIASKKQENIHKKGKLRINLVIIGILLLNFSFFTHYVSQKQTEKKEKKKIELELVSEELLIDLI